MLNLAQSICLILAIVGCSLAFLALVHRFWPSAKRREHNDLIGWQITVLGTTYAVIIGFMLYAVWNDFQIADGNAEAEANSLVNVARSAAALPDVQRRQIQQLASQYVNIMLNEEWPAMSRVTLAPASSRCMRKLWQVLTSTPTHNATEQTGLDHALTELSSMTEHRRLRQLEVYVELPGILWAVLIVGAIVTILSACLFGSEDFKLHVVQVAALALMIALVLAAIGDINHPFQGAVHVAPAGFERARATLDELNRNTP